MKKLNIKKFLLLFCALLSVFCLAACSDAISADKAKDSVKERELAAYAPAFELWATDMLQFLDTTDDQQIKEYAENAITLDEVNGKSYSVNLAGMNAETVSFYNSWIKSRQDLGKLRSIDEIEVQLSSETGTLCTVSVSASYEKRKCQFELVVDEDLALASGAINPAYTTMEKMQKAAVNTLIGMGTVFVVLIFISFIISLLKYVNKAGEKKVQEEEKKPAPAGAASEASMAAEAEADETDDLELVAVITAAIAASEGTSANGLVVRSIKKVKSNNWKNA